MTMPTLPRTTLFAVIGTSACLLIAVLAGLGIYISKTNADTVATPNAFSTPAILGEQAPQALLTKESGDIEYQLPGQSSFQKLEKDEERIPSGTNVKTGEKSLAHITFPDNSLMSLSQNTQVVIDYEDKKIKIFQLLGNTWHRVQSVLQGGAYSVETPNTLATVRGTEFNVAVLPNKRSEISVTESIVDVSKIVKNTEGQMEVKDSQRVEANKQVVVSENKSESTPPLKVEAIPVEKKQTVWFQRNVEITEEIKKAEIEATISPEVIKNTTGIEVTPEITKSITDEITKSVIEKVMDSIKENVELEKIDQNQVLQKNEEKVMEEFSKTEMTAKQSSTGDVQGVTAAPVVEDQPVTQEPEIGGVGAEDLQPTDEPTSEPTETERVIPTDNPEVTEEVQPQPTQEETRQEPEATPTPEETFVERVQEAIEEFFSEVTPTETPAAE